MHYLRCIKEDEAKYILKEVHEGIYGDHTTSRSLVSKISKTGYYWPPCRRMQRNTWKSVTNAKGLGTFNTFLEKR